MERLKKASVILAVASLLLNTACDDISNNKTNTVRSMETSAIDGSSYELSTQSLEEEVRSKLLQSCNDVKSLEIHSQLLLNIVVDYAEFYSNNYDNAGNHDSDIISLDNRVATEYYFDDNTIYVKTKSSTSGNNEGDKLANVDNLQEVYYDTSSSLVSYRGNNNSMDSNNNWEIDDSTDQVILNSPLNDIISAITVMENIETSTNGSLMNIEGQIPYDMMKQLLGDSVISMQGGKSSKIEIEYSVTSEKISSATIYLDDIVANEGLEGSDLNEYGNISGGKWELKFKGYNCTNVDIPEHVKKGD